MAAGVLLAAGESVRMGRPKPLLPWGDTTLVEYQVGEMLGAGLERVIVVLGHAWQDVKPYLTGPAVEVVINEAYRESKASSLRAVAASSPEATHWGRPASAASPRSVGSCAGRQAAAR
jgi:CTP:molybdopterin cytidylyltransferase MocA